MAAPIDPSKLTPEYLSAYSGTPIVGLAIAFTILEIVFLALRFYARSLGRVKFDIADGLMIVGLVFCLVLNAISLVLIKYAGVGYHVEAVVMEDPSKIVLYAKLLVTVAMWYPPTVVCPRLAMLYIYLQVLTAKPYRMAVYVIGATLVLWMTICTIMTPLQCTPLAFTWDKTIPGGHCIDQGAYWAWATFPNIFIDLAMIVVPLPTIWHLQIRPSLKWGLIFTFLLGVLGLAAGIARFVVFQQNNPLTDPTWQSGGEISWTIGEIGTYYIAACLPTLRPLVMKVTKKTTVASDYGVQSRQERPIKAISRPHISKTVTISVHENSMGSDHEYLELKEKDNRDFSYGRSH